MIGRHTLFDWAFWCVVAVNAAGVLMLIFADDSNQDAAGRGVESGFGIIGLLVLAAMVAIWWFVKTRFVRVPVFALLILPPMLAAIYLR